MMKGDITAMQYLRAHGDAPGPTHRPVLTGLIAGLFASLPAAAVRYWSGALASEADAAGLDLWQTVICVAVTAIVASLPYMFIFKRAANDTRGGWLFGSGYGFLLWMLGPVTVWQWATGKPLATGLAAMGLFGSFVVYGLVLGLAVPVVNKLIQSRMENV